MTIEKRQEYPYPRDLKSLADIEKYLKSLHKALAAGQSGLTEMMSTETSAITTFDHLHLNDIITKSPWVDVRAYGAVGDGTTDDSTAIKAAIAAAPNNGIVLFGPHTYAYSEFLTIPTYVSLCGAGAGATVLKYIGAGSCAILLGSWARLKDLSIVQTTDRTTERAGVYVGGAYNVLREVTIYGFKYGAKLEGDGVGCVYNSFYSVNFWGNFYDYYLTAKNNGWCNSNMFYEGVTGASADSGSICIYIDYNSVHELNGNFFFGISIETEGVGVFCDGLDNGFTGCRFETTGYQVWLGSHASGNLFNGSKLNNINDDSGGQNQVGLTTAEGPTFDHLHITNVRSGATQVAAGASAGELWKTVSHATLPNDVVMIGV